MNKAEAKRQRTLALKRLRDMGMTEAEIEAELGEPLSRVESERVSGTLINGSEIIDAEIVDNLPAVVNESKRYTAKRYRPYTPKTYTPRTPNPEHDERLAAHPERRCKAKKTDGTQCRRWAILGSTVCRRHGGGARQVLNKARTRLEMASNKLVGKELEFAFDDTKPPAVQLDAVKDSLNRVGLVKPAQLEVGPIKAFEEIYDDIASGSRAESRAARGYVDQDRESIDSPNPVAPGAKPHPALVDEQAVPKDAAVQANSDADCEAPASTLADEPSRPDRQYPSVHVVIGTEAMRLANLANLRGLPPGRSE